MSKSARGCGAKHMTKSTCIKHTRFGPLLEVEMSKSARGCGAKHMSKSKVQKGNDGYGPLMDVQMAFCVAGARVAHLARSEQSVRLLWHFEKQWQA